MQILARYIAESFAKNLLMSLVGLAGLFFFQTLITQLNDFPLGQLVILSLYDIPKYLVMVAPPAALVATILTLSALSKTNELIACYSIGISIEQIVWVILPIVFVLCCASLVVQDRIIPAFATKQNVFYQREINKRQDFFIDVKQEKVWYRSGNMIYNLRTFDPRTDTINGLGVYVFTPDFVLEEFIQAKVASYHPDGWRLGEGKQTRFDPKEGYPIVEHFKERTLKIKESPTDFKMIEQEGDRLRIKDLSRFIDINKKSGVDTRNFEVKLYSRFSMSFIPIVMMLLAIPFSISRAREGRLARDLTFAFALTFFYWLGNSISMSLGQKGTVPAVVSVWIPTLVFTALAVFLLKRMKT